MGRNTSIIIGITGRISTGKDTVSKIIKSKYNFQEINVDKIGHIILKLKQDTIVNTFGTKILNNQNEIERVKLRNIVFKDRKELNKLESITHPIIYKEVKQTILKSTSNKLVINAALLFKLNLAKFCNFIFIIKANDEIIKHRLISHRNIDESLISNILKYQENIFLNKNILNSKIINIINNRSYKCLEKKIRTKMKGVI